MTDSEINDLKLFLQKKIDILVPKKFKWAKQLKIVKINYNPPIFQDGGSLEITLDSEFDHSLNLPEIPISKKISTVSNFVRNLANAVEPNKSCYIYWE